MQSDFVMAASGMNLGIPYNRHAYFAGMVHDRKEWRSSVSVCWAHEIARIHNFGASIGLN